jgi:hypothetical protein
VDHRYRRFARNRAHLLPDSQRLDHGLHHPFAMIIHGNPAHKRFPQIKVQRLRGNPAHVRDSQLWGANVSN